MGRNKHSRKATHVTILFAAQEGRCASCGACMDRRSRNQIKKGDRNDARTVDHVVPLSRGGENRLRNKVLMHLRCNMAKGNRMPTGCELVMREMVWARLAWMVA